MLVESPNLFINLQNQKILKLKKQDYRIVKTSIASVNEFKKIN